VLRPCWAEAAPPERPQRAAASALSTHRSVGHGHGLGFKDLNATAGANASFVSLMHCAEPNLGGNGSEVVLGTSIRSVGARTSHQGVLHGGMRTCAQEMPLNTFRGVDGSGTGWSDTPRLGAVPADAATIAAAAAAEAEVAEMPAGAVMVHVFAASRTFEYRDVAAAIIGGSNSGVLAKEVRFAGAIISTGEAVMGWALPLGGGKYCAARERLEPKPPALSFVAAAAAADAASDCLRIQGVNAPAAGGGDALRVGAAGLTATRERLFGAGRGEATDNCDDAQSPASMLITGGLGALGTAVTLWAASKALAATIHLLGRSGRSSSPLFAQLGGLDGSAAAGAAAASVACVTATRCDTSSADEAGQVVARLARSVDHPSLSSAMHAAGALRDAMVGKHFAGSVRDVAGSKVGSLARIEAAGLSSAAGQPLGSMVLFSSTSALMGSAGQVSYSGRALAYIARHDIHHALR